jgi:zinc-ribbon domain
MKIERAIDPHDRTRRILRIVGPLLAIVGLGFTVTGLASFFSAMGSLEPPRNFWCAFVGLPLLGVGLAVSKLAYLGSIFRYFAREIAPVQKDTFNYLAEGTRVGIRGMAEAAGEGLAAGLSTPGAKCPVCREANPPAANFCSQCGAALRD